MLNPRPLGLPPAGLHPFIASIPPVYHLFLAPDNLMFTPSLPLITPWLAYPFALHSFRSAPPPPKFTGLDMSFSLRVMN
jgi:hypothetical protein